MPIMRMRYFAEVVVTYWPWVPLCGATALLMRSCAGGMDIPEGSSDYYVAGRLLGSLLWIGVIALSIRRIRRGPPPSKS